MGKLAIIDSIALACVIVYRQDADNVKVYHQRWRWGEYGNILYKIRRTVWSIRETLG